MSLFLLNILIAASWLLLQNDPTLVDFVLGFIMGFFMIALFRPVFGETRNIPAHIRKRRNYIRQTLGLVLFIIWFLWEFLLCNMRIAWAVMTKPNKNIYPQIFSMDISKLTYLETIILSQCITLTPGTTTVDVSEDENEIFIHAFNPNDVDEERKNIETGLIKMILRFTR